MSVELEKSETRFIENTEIRVLKNTKSVATNYDRCKTVDNGLCTVESDYK